MGVNDCYQLGYIQKTHGLKGDVSVFIDADYPEHYQNLESVLLRRGGQLIPFFIDTIQVQGDRAIVKFESVESLDEARELKGTEVWLPDSNLPELEPGQYYYHELPGFEVKENHRVLGKVTDVYNMVNCDLLALNYEGHEVLIPLTDEVVNEVSREDKTIHVTLPEGLIDIYVDKHAD